MREENLQRSLNAYGARWCDGVMCVLSRTLWSERLRLRSQDGDVVVADDVARRAMGPLDEHVVEQS